MSRRTHTRSRTAECITQHEIQQVLKTRTAEQVTDWFLTFSHAEPADRKRMLGSL